MRSFLLLLLSLMTGCEASSEVKGCPGGWLEFICKYPQPNGNYESIDLVQTKKTSPYKIIHSTQRNKWETEGGISVYHDTKNKKLRVVIKQLKRWDSRTYQCTFNQGERKLNQKATEKLYLSAVYDDCQKVFNQTAYRTAKTTITCDHPGNKSKPRVTFFCKENEFICEDILSTKSSKSDGTFTLTETNSGFSMSISNVSSHHTGVYWCGVETNGGSHRVALRKIQLKVEATIKNFTRSPTIGQNFTYWCSYPNGAPKNKFICKGEDPSICKPLESTAQSNNNTGKFSMKVDKDKRNITITVREVTSADTGTYWCGAESTDGRYSNRFFNRLKLIVVPGTTTPTFPVSTTQPTVASAASDGRSLSIIIGTFCVAVLLLLFVLILIHNCKRFPSSKNTRNTAAAQHIREDYVCEEIQEGVQKPDPGNAVTTIDATDINRPGPSASVHYSTINFQNTSHKASGGALIHKPTTACEYATVKFSQSPTKTSSTVNEPSSSSEEPLYSTVKKPQEQRGKIGPDRDL